MPRKLNLTGQTFGRLTAIEEAGRSKAGKYFWRCICECGNEVTAIGSDIKDGTTSSCGCLQRERTAEASLVHGQARQGKRSGLYEVWSGVIKRCTDEADKAYRHYGGRGITMHPAWRESFEAFARDVADGYAHGLTIERIDNDGNYEPGNVRWATRQEQARNRRTNRLVTFRGQTKPVIEWCELLGLKFPTVTNRLNRGGWSAERALTTGANPEALARSQATNNHPAEEE